jgi:hypothetical protein
MKSRKRLKSARKKPKKKNSACAVFGVAALIGKAVG